MPEKVKLEVLVARPPTRKCREVIAVMEEIVRRYPDQVRLVVFEEGAAWPEKPTPALMYALLKGSIVPACYVDGKFLVGARAPTLDEVEQEVADLLTS